MAAPPVRKKKYSAAATSGGKSLKPSLSDTSKSLRTSYIPPGVELLTSREVADILIVDIKLLADWRYQNRYLPYFSVGSKVRYDKNAVIAFLESNFNEERGDEIATRERMNIRKHLARVIDLIREEEVTDIAAFVIMGGGLAYGILHPKSEWTNS